MKRLLLTLGLAAAFSQAALFAKDSDFDGVEDAYDRCPGTAFEMTVAADGCPEDVSQTPVSLIMGLGTTYATGSYGGTETVDSFSSELSASLYVGDFYASVLGAYYFSGAADPTVAGGNDGGLSDTFLGAGYTFNPARNVYLTPGVLVKLPTADEGLGTGETDYGASLQGVYRFEHADLFAQYGYTVTYRNVSYGSVGAGFYPGAGSYLSVSYDMAQSYDPALEDLRSVSVFGIFTLYDTLSLRLNYSYGLSETASDHLVSAMLLKRF
jgi:hypothetical protein